MSTDAERTYVTGGPDGQPVIVYRSDAEYIEVLAAALAAATAENERLADALFSVVHRLDSYSAADVDDGFQAAIGEMYEFASAALASRVPQLAAFADDVDALARRCKAAEESYAIGRRLVDELRAALAAATAENERLEKKLTVAEASVLAGTHYRLREAWAQFDPKEEE